MLDNVLKIAQIVSLIGIPIVLLFISSHVTSKLKNSELSLQYVRLAIEVLRNSLSTTNTQSESKSDPLRDWASEILAVHSPIPLGNQLLLSLKSGNSVLPRDDSIFDENLEAAKVILKEAGLKQEILNRTKYNFEKSNDDLGLQRERGVYLNLVVHILHYSNLTKAHAVAIWLAGVNLHNNSLIYKNWLSVNLDDHLEEIQIVHDTLVKSLLERANVSDASVVPKVLSYLEIHLRNYRSHLIHTVNFRNRST